jgi:hypothetical protein
MADINVERKGGGRSPLPWILGLLALALLAFLLLRGCSDEGDPAPAAAPADTVVTVDTTAMVPATAPAVGAGAAAGAAAAVSPDALPVGEILASADAYAGQTMSGTVTVPQTPSDRGFWVETGGERMFAILAERSEQVKDIDPGQTVRLTDARILRGSESAQIPADVDAEAKQTAQGQPLFLLVPANGVEIVSGGSSIGG